MRKDIFKLTIKIGCFFIIVTTFFGTVYYQEAETAKELLSAYMETIESMIQEDGSITWSRLFLNNIFACAQAVAMGIIPVIYLPVWVLLSNSIMTGAVFGLATAEAAMDPIKSLVFGLLPHGIFELPGLFISIALGFYLCRMVTRILFRRTGDVTLLDVLNGVAKGYVLAVLPLLTIASLIECFITPALMSWAGI